MVMETSDESTFNPNVDSLADLWAPVPRPVAVGTPHVCCCTGVLCQRFVT